MRTILICDDSVTMQQVVRMTFVGQEFQVEAAGDCDEALALAHRVSPAVILADLSMAGKTGYDLTEAVRRDGQLRTTPVLLLGSTYEPVDEERARRCGADGHMVKPFESQALIDRVREMASQPHVPAAAPAEEPLVEIEAAPPDLALADQPAALSVPEPPAPADSDFELEIVMEEPAPTPAEAPPRAAAPALAPSPAEPPQPTPPVARPATPRQPSPPPPALSFSPPPTAAPFSAPARPPSPAPAPPRSPVPAAPRSPAPAAAPPRSPAPAAPRSPAPPASVFSAPARRPTGPSAAARPGGPAIPGARPTPGAGPGSPAARPAPGSRAIPSRGAQAPSPWVPPPSAAPRPTVPGAGRGPASSTARPVPGSQVRRTPPVPGARPVPVPRPAGSTAATMIGLTRPPGVPPAAMGRTPVASATRPHPGAGRMSEQDIVARLSKDVIERVVWEVVPELAETIIRQELDRLIAAREREPK